jgi:hypothetical protein
LPRLASKLDPPAFNLTSTRDYRPEPLHLAIHFSFSFVFEDKVQTQVLTQASALPLSYISKLLISFLSIWARVYNQTDMQPVGLKKNLSGNFLASSQGL